MKSLTSYRDILMFEVNGDILVSAVDSCGGIGNQPHDAIKIDPVITGMFTARVALMEVMAVGAKAAFASLAISSGPHTAEPLIAGVRKALGDALPLVISTEKNIPTSMTGIGVTVTGSCEAGGLLVAGAKAGDVLYCAGLPLVGKEILINGAQLFEVRHLTALLQNRHVHALIPVGSRGIAAEAGVLAGESGLKARLTSQEGIDLCKSAGPSTCAVFAADPHTLFKLDLPVFELGNLY